jgi:NAD(P)H dehydrogenase (quinone)
MESPVPKILVLYHSAYGHVETMARAIAEGASSVEGAVVDVKRVPETVPESIARASHFKLDQAAPIATIEDLANYDAIIVGAGTRFGRINSQMAAFLDQAGGLWARGALNGKVGAAFTSTATQHGGQETTLFSIITNLLHFGMTIVGLPYSFQGQMRLDEVTGGSPYGATTIAGGDGSRQPSANELEGARHQGRLVAETAAKLFGEAGGGARWAGRRHYLDLHDHSDSALGAFVRPDNQTIGPFAFGEGSVRSTIGQNDSAIPEGPINLGQGEDGAIAVRTGHHDIGREDFPMQPGP